MYPQLKQSLQILAGALLVLSCSAPATNPRPSKPASAPASTQAATKPVDKTPRALIKIELGSTAQTLDRLHAKFPAVLSASQLEYQLKRELKEAASALDLTQGAEAELGYADDTLAFVVFSFALKKEHSFPALMKTTAGLDTKGHQFAVRPLPGSLLSPFNRVLYLDVIDGRLHLMDHPEGMQRLPLKAGLATPSMRASLDFASLWYVFGLPLQEAYISEKDKRQFRSQTNEPAKPEQSDIFWESFFVLGGTIARIELQAEAQDGLLLAAEVSTKVKLPSNMDSLTGGLYEVIPESHFGVRAILPKSVIRVIAAARRRLAPPAFDSLAMYYPLAENMRGALSFGGAIDGRVGFWAVGQYPLDDVAMARLSLQRHFSETPKAEAIFLEPGRTFQFKASEKDKDGSTLDVVNSSLKDPTALDRALQIDEVSTQYKIVSAVATSMTGKDAPRRAALLTQKKAPQVIPAALSTLLERPLLSQSSASQPASQPSAATPFAFFWLSQAGIALAAPAPIDTAATISQQGDKLLFKVAFLP